MKLGNKETFELLGVTSIVVSLAFVGYQLIQDRDIALADSYSFAIEARKEDVRVRIQSAEYLSMSETMWTNDGPPTWWLQYLEQTDTPALDSVREILIRQFSIYLDLLEIDSTYFRYQKGLISEEYWDVAEQFLRGMLSDPFVRAVAMDLPLATSIRSLMVELISETDGANGT